MIVLSGGRTIYQQSPMTVGDYFEPFGLEILAYGNPADKLSNIASKPHRVLRRDVTIKMLAEHNRIENEEEIESLTLSEQDSSEEKSSLDQVGTGRSVS